MCETGEFKKGLKLALFVWLSFYYRNLLSFITTLIIIAVTSYTFTTR